MGELEALGRVEVEETYVVNADILFPPESGSYHHNRLRVWRRETDIERSRSLIPDIVWQFLAEDPAFAPVHKAWLDNPKVTGVWGW